MEEPIRDNKITEIAKKVPRVPNKDKEQADDQGSNEERETKIEQTSKDLNRVRETYFVHSNTEKENGETKHTTKKRTMRKDHKPVQLPKVQKEVKGKVITAVRGKT